MKNPYLDLYGLMVEATKIPKSFFIGKIKSVSPFEVALNDLILDKDDLLVDSNLMKLHNANDNNELKDKLNANDKVVLLRIDGKFILISKVVSI